MSRYDALENFYMIKEANSRAKQKRRKAARRAARVQQAPASSARAAGDALLREGEVLIPKETTLRLPNKHKSSLRGRVAASHRVADMRRSGNIKSRRIAAPNAAKLRRKHGLSDSFQSIQLQQERLNYDRRQRRRVGKARFAEEARRHGMAPREYARLQASVPADMLPARMSDTGMTTTPRRPEKLRASYTNTPPVAHTSRQIGFDAAPTASKANPRMLTGPKQLTVAGSPRGSSAAASAAQSAGGMSNLAKGGIAAGILGLGGAYLYNRNRQK